MTFNSILEPIHQQQSIHHGLLASEENLVLPCQLDDFTSESSTCSVETAIDEEIVLKSKFVTQISNDAYPSPYLAPFMSQPQINVAHNGPGNNNTKQLGSSPFQKATHIGSLSSEARSKMLTTCIKHMPEMQHLVQKSRFGSCNKWYHWCVELGHLYNDNNDRGYDYGDDSGPMSNIYTPLMLKAIECATYLKRSKFTNSFNGWKNDRLTENDVSDAYTLKNWIQANLKNNLETGLKRYPSIYNAVSSQCGLNAIDREVSVINYISSKEFGDIVKERKLGLDTGLLQTWIMSPRFKFLKKLLEVCSLISEMIHTALPKSMQARVYQMALDNEYIDSDSSRYQKNIISFNVYLWFLNSVADDLYQKVFVYHSSWSGYTSYVKSVFKELINSKPVLVQNNAFLDSCCFIDTERVEDQRDLKTNSIHRCWVAGIVYKKENKFNGEYYKKNMEVSIQNSGARTENMIDESHFLDTVTGRMGKM